MYRTIYLESDIRQHSRVDRILSRFPDAEVITCNRYTEIFNRKSQDFRLQKIKPSLILARKHSGYIHTAPAGYGVGGDHNFYFSTMLNCLYDCRYCFLQGMFRSANHVVFINFEDFAEQMHKTASKFSKDEQVWFFSGYDCDSLALEPVIGMADFFIDSIVERKNVWLELRTKSTQIRSMLNRSSENNVVTAFSFTPAKMSLKVEHKVPSVEKRLVAMQKLQKNGWAVGLRFDPLIFTDDYKMQYQDLFESIFSSLDRTLIHSVSIGVFRLPKDFFKDLERLYPDSEFVAQPFVQRNGMVSYPSRIESEMKKWCYAEIRQYLDADRIYFAEITAPEPNENNALSSIPVAENRH